MTDDMDARIEALLKAPERAPDDAFVAAMRLQIEAEIRLQAAASRARQEFAWKAAAGAVVVAAFVFLARMEPPTSAEATVPLLSPAMLGFLLLGLWAAVDLPMLARRGG